MQMDLWYTERQTPHLGITCQITETLCHTKTPYQELAVLDTLQFGRMLVLNGTVQTTVRDEFVYHEMIAHVAMQTHPDPRRVLVVGGGDGGTLREIVKYPSLKEAVLVEIDEEVIKASRRYLPEISVALDHPLVNIRVGDGIAHVREHTSHYDLIIIDSTDPVGPAVGLFQPEFYASVYNALREDGIMVAQTESPFFNQELIRQTYRDISAIFPLTRLYLASIPTYPSGLWSFTLGSRRYDPLQLTSLRYNLNDTRYYNFAVHRAAFALPVCAQKLLSEDK